MVTLTRSCDLDRVKINKHANIYVKRLLPSKVTVPTQRHTHSADRSLYLDH